MRIRTVLQDAKMKTCGFAQRYEMLKQRHADSRSVTGCKDYSVRCIYRIPLETQKEYDAETANGDGDGLQENRCLPTR